MVVSNPIVHSGIPEAMLASRRLTLQEQMAAAQAAREEMERAAAEQQMAATTQWFLRQYDDLNPPSYVEGPEPPGGVGPRWQEPDPQYLERRELFKQLPVNLQGEIVGNIQKHQDALEAQRLKQEIERDEQRRKIASIERLRARNNIPPDNPQYQALVSAVESGMSPRDIAGMFPGGAGGTSASPQSVYETAIRMGYPEAQANIFASQAQLTGQAPKEMFEPYENLPPDVMFFDAEIAAVKEQMIRLEEYGSVLQESLGNIAIMADKQQFESLKRQSEQMRAQHMALQQRLADLQDKKNTALHTYLSGIGQGFSGMTYGPQAPVQQGAPPAPVQQAPAAPVPGQHAVSTGPVPAPQPTRAVHKEPVQEAPQQTQAGGLPPEPSLGSMFAARNQGPPSSLILLPGQPRIEVEVSGMGRLALPRPQSDVHLVVMVRELIGLPPSGPLTPDARAEVARIVREIAQQMEAGMQDGG